jgi:hypothetical protein
LVETAAIDDESRLTRIAPLKEVVFPLHQDAIYGREPSLCDSFARASHFEQRQHARTQRFAHMFSGKFATLDQANFMAELGKPRSQGRASRTSTDYTDVNLNALCRSHGPVRTRIAITVL